MSSLEQEAHQRLKAAVDREQKYLDAKIQNVADKMRRFADEIERDAKMFEDDPAEAVGQVLNDWSNHVNNLRLDLLPTAAVDLVLARQALKEWEQANE